MNRRSCRKLFPAIIVFSLIVYYLLNKMRSQSHLKPWQIGSSVKLLHQLNQPIFSDHYSNEKRILVVAKSHPSDQIAHITQFITWSKFKFDLIQCTNGTLTSHSLADGSKALYSVIIFESFRLFELADSKMLATVRQYRIGLILLDNDANCKFQICKLNSQVKDFFTTTKFDAEKNFYLKPSRFDESGECVGGNFQSSVPVMVCDDGKDVISKNLPHAGLRYVVVKIKLQNVISSLILDLIEYSSYGRIGLGLERTIQIDIDDIFVGPSGLKMVPNDVNALVEFQDYLNEFFFEASENKFKFNLGFSGHFYGAGTGQEKMGDQLLIGKKDQFTWFDHTWSHLKPHSINYSYLEEQFSLNFNFAKKHKLPTQTFYSISPHHSGIYPVSNNLYDLWSKFWDIKVTSTEHYPHIEPHHIRKGFVHKNIMVLPRQSCEIYTTTNFFKDFPNGINELMSKITGKIFNIVLLNRINIFMTHMTNYANDRVALFLFKNLFAYLKERTNLKFIFKPSIQLAKDYFHFYPDEREPIWTNPCDDKRHLNIWQFEQKDCSRFPKLIILGPQKTGTTALQYFLQAHPLFRSSTYTQEHYEETQFFATEYNRGIDWYLKLFESDSTKINFEKSANYFSNSAVPLRIRSLIPTVKFIIILFDPIKRAYSWYHHMRAHQDPIAINYTFYEVITHLSHNKSDLKNIQNLRGRCLNSGLYLNYLQSWFSYFDKNQFLLVDGEELINEPYLVMNSIQLFMNASQIIDYKKMFIFDADKNFYCLNVKSGTDCLGPGKGRKYQDMDTKSMEFLKEYYRRPNIQLRSFLVKNQIKVPKWLKT